MVSPLQSFVNICYGGHLGFLELVDPGRFALVGCSIIGRVDRVLNRPRKISVLLKGIPVRVFTKNGRIFVSYELKRCYSVDDQENS
ncbi:hypothetical protein DPMN_188117 [Dreissena polymorpha]|uniref:Uncharacterized protein n=1 Tax=Dreissena polymorpha TaxID=45954 RepID=A0A9D4DRV2_DREPO|nr:hypothetical protein DPMN_188117 [Dreissena polymorpha]